MAIHHETIPYLYAYTIHSYLHTYGCNVPNE